MPDTNTQSRYFRHQYKAKGTMEYCDPSLKLALQFKEGPTVPLTAPASLSSSCCICSHWRLNIQKPFLHKCRLFHWKLCKTKWIQTWTPLEDKLSALLSSNEVQCFSTACVCHFLWLQKCVFNVGYFITIYVYTHFIRVYILYDNIIANIKDQRCNQEYVCIELFFLIWSNRSMNTANLANKIVTTDQS